MAAAGVIHICNRALQLLGARRIIALSDDSVSARACNLCYASTRDAELRKHPWRFAITRAQLAADAVAPVFGKARSFPLPSDYIRLVEDYPELNLLDRDYEIEGNAIYSDFTAPLEIRYVSRVEDPTLMDPLFKEMVSHAMAVAMCEEITQSNTKIANIANMYDDVRKEARRANAFETLGQKAPEDPWLTVRR